MTNHDESLFDRVADEMAAHLAGETTGHDMHHLWRVNRLGVRIAEDEGADPRIVDVAALVHDLHRARGEGFTHPEDTIPEIREIRAGGSVAARRNVIRRSATPTARLAGRPVCRAFASTGPAR